MCCLMLINYVNYYYWYCIGIDDLIPWSCGQSMYGRRMRLIELTEVQNEIVNKTICYRILLSCWMADALSS